MGVERDGSYKIGIFGWCDGVKPRPSPKTQGTHSIESGAW